MRWVVGCILIPICGDLKAYKMIAIVSMKLIIWSGDVFQGFFPRTLCISEYQHANKSEN